MSYKQGDYNDSNHYRRATVNVRENLIIREHPTVNSVRLTSAPLNSSLEIIEDYYKEDFIDGSQGYWLKVRYGNTVGYAWGNYLTRQ